MTDAYRFLREVEHRLQMIADEQTQTLPAEREGARALRALSRLCRPRRLRRGAGRRICEKVQGYYARLFEKAPAPDRPDLHFPPMPTITRRSTGWPSSASARPLEASAIVRHWLAGGHRSLKGEVGASHLHELVPVLIEQIGAHRQSERHA